MAENQVFSASMSLNRKTGTSILIIDGKEINKKDFIDGEVKKLSDRIIEELSTSPSEAETQLMKEKRDREYEEFLDQLAAELRKQQLQNKTSSPSS